MSMRAHINDIAAVAAATELVKGATVEQRLPRQHRVHAITCNQYRKTHEHIRSARYTTT